MIGSIRPDGDPAGVVEEGVGIDVGRGVVLALVEGANFHGRDLRLCGHLSRAICGPTVITSGIGCSAQSGGSTPCAAAASRPQ
jgi:hypothetical protein